ncbi:MAG: DEAD/DEAH box helicase [Gammaproteobacteria bacterium]|nr:DEAD/DEAH box helicase [Gammaproteobacteria bacterium]
MSDIPDSFQSLGLAEPILRAIVEVGYEQPSPIQAASIPPLLAGNDILGQAQTGTGKTAAFALPLLSRIDPDRREPQLLVLAPTRELAIQVAEAFQRYARYMKDFHVLPVYGGQGYDRQLRQLKQGVQVVVGTPGRVMDHIRRKTLKLDNLQALVLDEADEMLRMGFIDDVEWILEHTPDTRQTALFSATMPSVIKKVAQKHLRDPKEIRIKSQTSTAKTIRQRYWQVSGLHKLDALTRIMEMESFDAMLIFVRTRTATVELAEKLAARGYSCDALNGDIPQNLREKAVEKLKNGQLDILVATDVAARGLDVERISHVVNYDIPYDTESYVHRIGRTGRAGRTGDAILFVAPREQRLLSAIEKATKQPIERMQLPSVVDVNLQRISRFKQRITDTLASDDLELFYNMVSEYQQDEEVDPIQIAAALARMVQGNEPLLVTEKAPRRQREDRETRRESSRDSGRRSERERRPERDRKRFSADDKAQPLKDFPEVEMQRFRLEVGYQNDVKPGNIVGAIANEAEIDSCYIGHIEIFEDFTTVDLPDGMPKETLQALKKAYVCGQKLDIKAIGGSSSGAANRKPRSSKPRKEGERGGPGGKSGSRQGKGQGKGKGRSDKGGAGKKSKPRAASKTKTGKKPPTK